MPCYGSEDGSMWICTTTAITVYRRVLKCRACHASRRHVIEDFGWYGGTRTCCTCGIQYSDGWRLRATKKQRVANAERARTLWTTAPTAAAAKAAFRAWLADYITDPEPLAVA